MCCSVSLDPSEVPPGVWKWRDVADPSEERTPNQDMCEVNLMSYNLLAEGLDGTQKFPNVTREVLSFLYRGPRIINEIKCSGAGIICL